MKQLWVRRRVELGLVAMVVALSTVYLCIGSGLFMDDWWSLRNVQFDGAFAAAGTNQWYARPVTGLIYTFVFGVIGPHPVLLVLLLAVLNSLSVVLFFRLARVFFDSFVATAAAALWVVMPNHLSLEVWGSTSNIAVSQTALLAGTLLLAREQVRVRTVVVSSLLLVVAIFSYEAVAPVAAVAVVVVPWARRRAFDKRVLAIAGGAVIAAGLWSWIHVNPAKKVSSGLIDISPVLPANLGWGIGGFGPAGDLAFVLGLAIVGMAVFRLASPQFRTQAGAPERAVVVGFVMMIVGALAFIRYSFEPLGGGDRANYLSAFGGALVWAGGAAMLARAERRVALGAIALLVLVMAPVRWDRWQRWHTAGVDAVAITEGIKAMHPTSASPVTVGPKPIIIENFTAFEGQANMEAGVQYATNDRDATIKLTFDQAAFDAAPPDRRFDLRPVSKLDDDTGD